MIFPESRSPVFCDQALNPGNARGRDAFARHRRAGMRIRQRYMGDKALLMLYCMLLFAD